MQSWPFISLDCSTPLGLGSRMRRYRPGDRVVVPWGLDELAGTVVRVFGPRSHPFVMVRVDLVEGDEEVDEAEVGFKASDIRPAPVEARG